MKPGELPAGLAAMWSTQFHMRFLSRIWSSRIGCRSRREPYTRNSCNRRELKRAGKELLRHRWKPLKIRVIPAAPR